jgi:hypothetical protein
VLDVNGWFKALQRNTIDACGVLEMEYSRARQRNSAISLSVLSISREVTHLGVPEMSCVEDVEKGAGMLSSALCGLVFLKVF